MEVTIDDLDMFYGLRGVLLMLYCSYTHSSPPLCVVNRVVELNERVKEVIKKALRDKEKKHCVSVFDQIYIACDFCASVLNEDENSIEVSLETYLCSAGCWDYSIIVVIPRKLLE